MASRECIFSTDRAPEWYHGMLKHTDRYQCLPFTWVVRLYQKQYANVFGKQIAPLFLPVQWANWLCLINIFLISVLIMKLLADDKE